MTGTDHAPLQRVHALLSDGRLHSGVELASACGVSRPAVGRAVRKLRQSGLDVRTVRGRGFQLVPAVALLDAARIQAGLSAAVAPRLRHGQTVWCTGSTNADLLARGGPPPGHFDFLAAEYQSAGRGRRARPWLAPPGGAVCLSLGWTFPRMPPRMGALGLAVGVCMLRALAHCGFAGVALKWPNDLVVGTCKLGGILVEVRAEAAGPVFAVTGVGLNVALGTSVLDRVQESGTTAIDLATLAGAVPCDRHELAAALISALAEGLLYFEQDGFDAFAAEWRAADALAGRAVQVRLDTGVVAGHARGIDADGALCVQTVDGLQRFMTGDASVRAAS